MCRGFLYSSSFRLFCESGQAGSLLQSAATAESLSFSRGDRVGEAGLHDKLEIRGSRVFGWGELA